MAKPRNRKDFQEEIQQEFITTGGEVICIYGCDITLFENCFKEPTKVNVAIDVGSSHLPDGYIAISPTLYVNAERKFEKPATVNITTWCTSDGSDHSKHQTVHVLHKPKDANEWQVLCQLPLALKRDQCSLRFQCKNFSPVVVAIQESQCGHGEEFTITGLVHQKGEYLKIIFFNEDKLTRKYIQEDYSVLEHNMERIDPIDVALNDEIKVIVENEEEKTRFPQPRPVAFTIDKTFMKTPKKALDVRMPKEIKKAYLKLRFEKNKQSLQNDRLFSYSDQDNISEIMMSRYIKSNTNYPMNFIVNCTQSVGTMLTGNASANFDQKDCTEIVSTSSNDSGRTAQPPPTS